MYQIRCDDVVIHDSGLPELSVINAKCKLALNKTGSLTFSIAPTHPHYDKIHKLSSEITLYQDDKVLFCGRVLNDEIDFDNIKYIECEGELSYFLDTIMRGGTNGVCEYDSTTSDNVIKTYLNRIVSEHNPQTFKDFEVGNITVKAPNNYLYKVHNYQNTLDIINSELLDVYGGYLMIRHENNTRYIDYLTYSDLNTCNQTIEFGKNIIDMNRNINGENIYTALIPLGAVYKYESTDEGKTERRLCLANPFGDMVEDENGRIWLQDDYIYDEAGVNKWGWIWKVIKWDDVNDTDTLLSLALKELRSVRNPKLDIELSAIDLHLLDVNIDSISVGDKIHCISAPHNMDNWLIVKGMSIDIDSPENTTIELISPTEKMVADDSITSNNKDNEKSVDDIKNQLKEDYPTYKDLESYTPSEDLSNYATKPYVSQQIDDVKTWTGNNYVPNETLDNKINDLKTWTDDNYVQKGSSSDLSEYAKIADVNTAFNELATALGGL